jgi:predicted SAM-dependent methyltransferase
VQVTWLGYPNTTGLHAIDYILADSITVPAGEEVFYTEKIWRLPKSYICFTPPDTDVSINPLPALENGYVTFGSFNNPVKINDTVAACWAEILRSVPGSVLLFKNGHLDSEAIRESFRQRFLDFGVGPERLLFEGSSSRSEILASYRRIDIALDPFPYTGTTTTCEGIWMGVPSLTLKMSRGIYSHTGELIMRSVGLTSWVAESVEECVEKALEFANDLQGLAQIRAGLRGQLLTSPLCNAPRFALNLESALRGMWQQWCQHHNSNDPQFTKPQRKLHIGGKVHAENWEIFSINEGPHVDHVGNANDLSRFPNDTFSEIYASHVLEHFDYKGELLATLAEWNRVLEPGGVLSVSVPDLDTLATLYLDKTNQTIDYRFLMMSMMFGGHADNHDYHNVGLNEELLSHCLKMADFVDARRVTEFGVFEDTSNLTFKGERISLNMVAYKKTSCIEIA